MDGIIMARDYEGKLSLFGLILNSNFLADASGTKGKVKWVQISFHVYNNVLQSVIICLGTDFLLLLIKLFLFMMRDVEGFLADALDVVSVAC